MKLKLFASKYTARANFDTTFDTTLTGERTVAKYLSKLNIFILVVQRGSKVAVFCDFKACHHV